MRTKLSLPLIAILLLAACSGHAATATPEAPTPSPTPVVSPTPGVPLAILILPADMPQDDSDRYQTLVYDLAQSQKMRFQVRNTLTVEELQMELPALKVVIALPPDPGLAVLTVAAPGVQFLAVNIPGVSAGGNLSVIGSADKPVDRQAFLAGYITAMVAPEWRVGILTQKDTPTGEAARTAFTNGYVYFCGYCRNPNFTQPSYEYPIVVRIPTDAQEGEYIAYAAALLDYWVRAVFVSPEVATPDTISYLEQYNVLVVGETLPSEDLRPYWVVSIQPDMIPAIQSIFPDLVAGKGGQNVPTPLYLTDANPEVFGEGKLRMAQEVLDGLQNGTIGTGVTP